MQAQVKQSARVLSRKLRGMPASDGAGVELTRIIGQPQLNQLDPFLLLDLFRSDRPDDYIAGFPPHPHRGFETVTYLLAGRMRHSDSAGHEGVIEPGGVQWMSAARGIVHSEMPEQENGLLHGYQLWVNLPAAHKLDAPAYQEFPAAQIPEEQRDGGVSLRVIAGRTTLGSEGPVRQPLTEPVYWHIRLPPGSGFADRIPAGHNAFVQVIHGQLLVDDAQGRPVTLVGDELGQLTGGEAIRLRAGSEATELLLIAGRPLNEPVARGGPFVMNSREEVQQVFDDYRSGRF